jgi:hypothetical protein
MDRGGKRAMTRRDITAWHYLNLDDGDQGTAKEDSVTMRGCWDVSVVESQGIWKVEGVHVVRRGPLDVWKGLYETAKARAKVMVERGKL